MRRRPLAEGGHTEVSLPAALAAEVEHRLATTPQLALAIAAVVAAAAAPQPSSGDRRSAMRPAAAAAWCSAAYLDQLRAFLKAQVRCHAPYGK